MGSSHTANSQFKLMNKGTDPVKTHYLVVRFGVLAESSHMSSSFPLVFICLGCVCVCVRVVLCLLQVSAF